VRRVTAPTQSGLAIEGNRTTNVFQTILKPGESLASIATWADTVKRVHFGPDVVVSDKDTQAFRRDLRNKNNRRISFSNAMPHVSGGHLRGFAECGDVT